MSMVDCLPEDAVFPEYYRCIELGEEALNFAFQYKQFIIEPCMNLTIARIVMLRNNQDMALNQRGVIGCEEEVWSLFENIGNFATLTKSTVCIV